MTRKTNARIAGSTFPGCIAEGIASLVVFEWATNGEGITAKLAGSPNTRQRRVLWLCSIWSSASRPWYWL
jgi:hypothetical protein